MSELNILKWRARLQRQAVSGKSVQQFCVDEDIPRSHFYAWRKRFAVQANQGAGFVPIRVNAAAKPARALPLGHRFWLEQGELCWQGSALPDPEWLAGLLKALRGC